MQLPTQFVQPTDPTGVTLLKFVSEFRIAQLVCKLLQYCMGFCRKGKFSLSTLWWRQGKLAVTAPCTISLVFLRAFSTHTPMGETEMALKSTLLGYGMMWDRAPAAVVQHNFLWMGVIPKETESRNLCLGLQVSEKLLRLWALLDYPHHSGTATFMFLGDALLLG